MRPLAIVGALALVFSFSASARADADRDHMQAFALCRTEVAQRVGVEPSHVQLSDFRTQGRQIRVNLRVWAQGGPTNVRCDVETGGDGPRVAALDPPLAASQSVSR